MCVPLFLHAGMGDAEVGADVTWGLGTFHRRGGFDGGGKELGWGAKACFVGAHATCTEGGPTPGGAGCTCKMARSLEMYFELSRLFCRHHSPGTSPELANSAK